MGEEYIARTFKSGNSVALRLPKALGVKEGVEMKVRENRGGFIVEPVPAKDDKIDLTGIFGSIPGITRPPCDENPRDWHAVSLRA
ncbi:AbrB/MazE/SpoVT family DNA-binding domain-containing protein [Sphingomonas psychrotolerans]|uniref:AbrB/MazE/SpoVT family DNA-binding domain-containing protein n=1 Tax=Sphingomonas psychrotolerans TaxID=1327635 RepID=A0ABU3N0P9_9SPHN|nr:AbrB/MazE/SpoVT family DNA-binding domain-containing protein [Sphingomonas psychrotolerans]MDT8758127.1 AbrB/MazE/SpoVT family DNA-binding domain-containing protein [Sphingomonas psychrotolerans]